MEDNSRTIEDRKYYDHLCGCGCRGRIPIRRSHRRDGIPKYLPGHNRRGKKNTSEHNHRISEGRMGISCSESAKRKLSAYNTGKHLSEETKKKIAYSSTNRRQSKESIEKIRRYNSTDAYKNSHWNNPEYIRKQIQARNVHQNKSEKFLESLISQFGLRFVGDGQVIIAGKCPDFINEEKHLIIELFGDYWHSQELTGVPEAQHEKERIELFRSAGYQTLVVWECELKSPDLLVERITKWIMQT